MPIERHTELTRAIEDCFADISNGASILEEARAGRQAGRWYAFLLMPLVGASVLFASRAAPQLSSNSAWLVQSGYAALLLIVVSILVLAAGFSRRGHRAPFASGARRRMRLWALVKAIRAHERRYMRELGEAVAHAKRNREAYRPPPQEIEGDALACADELASAAFTLPIGASEVEYVNRGSMIVWWRPWFWIGVAVATMALFATLWAYGPLASLAPAIANVLRRAVPISAGIGAISILVPTMRLISLRGFHSDGAKAVTMSVAQKNLIGVLNRAARYGRENVLRIGRSVVEARRRTRAELRPKTVFDETRDGIARAMDDATSRAIIQALAGSVIAIAALSIAAYSFLWVQGEIQGPRALDIGFWTSAAAKATFAIGANALAFFFLIGFRKSQADAKFFRNELTTIEGRMMALIEAKQLAEHTDPELKRFAVATAGMILIGLGAIDRNPLGARGAANANVHEHQLINSEAQILAEFLRGRPEAASGGSQPPPPSQRV